MDRFAFRPTASRSIDSETGTVRTAVPVGRAPGRSPSMRVRRGLRTEDRTRSLGSTIGRMRRPRSAASSQGCATSRLAPAPCGRRSRLPGSRSVNVSTQTASSPVPLLSRSGAGVLRGGDRVRLRLALGRGWPTEWVGAAAGGSERPGASRGYASAPPRGIRSRSGRVASGSVTCLRTPSSSSIRRRCASCVGSASALPPRSRSAGTRSGWPVPTTERCGGCIGRNGYRARTQIPVGGDPVAVAFGQGAAWAALADGTVARIDAARETVRRTRVASTLNAITVGVGAVWAVAGPVSFL